MIIQLCLATRYRYKRSEGATLRSWHSVAEGITGHGRCRISSQRPERFMVGDGSFEPHARIDKNLGEVNHGLKRRHLLRVCPGIPYTDIRHGIGFAVNAHIVGLVAL